MAIANTGTIQNFGITAANSGTVSTAVDVPSDAQLVIVGISGFGPGSANFYSSGGMTFTKGGVDTAMTSATGAADGDTGNFQAAVFYLVNPDTGTNKTLKWDWAGAGSSVNAPLISVSFWKGIDTASPVRDVDGVQGGGVPFTTPTLTAQTGDLIVAWVGIFASPEGTATTWSNLSTLANCPLQASNADGAWGTGSPTGNTTVTITLFSQAGDGGIVAVVLKPEAAPALTQTSTYTDADAFFSHTIAAGHALAQTSVHTDVDAFFTHTIAGGQMLVTPQEIMQANYHYHE